MSAVEEMGPNAAGLVEDAHRERRNIRLLAAPSLGLIGVLMVGPMLWLFYLSFFNEHGEFTFEHYARMFSQGAYFNIFWTTFEVSAVVTVLCAVLAYPIAYLLAQMPARWANILMLGILVPFWTALLVRTYAWLVLLQRRGLINDLLVSTGIIERPIALVHNLTGTLIGMVHIMIPFMVLPLYATMKTIDPNLVRASCSLGASPTRAFWGVYFPLSAPGLYAGMILIFIFCLGFYVTPSVLGGGRVIMLAMRIENSVSLYPSWGAASALGVVLLLLTVVLMVLGAWISRLARR
jgi:putative spermidine/putrescine transport system permease protein/spermidine/putrescine transport system permease protein